MQWIRTLIHRPALVTVIYLILFLFGTYSYSKLPIDMLPEMDVPVVTVVTAYPGASALDVENKLSEPLEESLGAIANLKEYHPPVAKIYRWSHWSLPPTQTPTLQPTT